MRPDPRSLLLRGVSILVVDLETTGLGPSDRPVELGWALTRNGIVTYADSRLVNPYCPIPAEATAIHGITDAMVSECAGLRWQLPMLESAARTASIVAAHNVEFDRGMLGTDLDRPWLCTMRWARKVFGKGRLQDLVQDLGLAARVRALGEVRPHRAKWDALCAAALLGRLLDASAPDVSLGEVWDLCEVKCAS